MFDPDKVTWRLSTRSGNNGSCVAVAFVKDNVIAVRNSNRPEQGYVVFSNAEWDAFIWGAKNCEFDLDS